MRGATNGYKKYIGIIAAVELLIIIGLVVSVVLLAASRGHTNNSNQVASQTNAGAKAVSAQYKLTACKSGATQTIGNAGYVVGTDIAPGSYKIVAQTTDGTNAGFSSVDVYSSKTAYDQYNNPTSKQQAKSASGPEQSIMANDGQPTYTKLSDGQYMNVYDDPAIFTCQ